MRRPSIRRLSHLDAIADRRGGEIGEPARAAADDRDIGAFTGTTGIGGQQHDRLLGAVAVEVARQPEVADEGHAGS